VADRGKKPRIYVLAGTNGAGKSSIGGARLSQNEAECFDPDKAARGFLSKSPGMSLADANREAWRQGKRLLEQAIAERLDFAFETTLGGHTITGLLKRALSEKIEVRIWYVGLATPELHISRVRSRVARGGHDIPEARIRERYDASRLNLIDLLPNLTELRVYDNSEESDPQRGIVPEPKLLLHTEGGRIVSHCDLGAVPDWAKPILAAAMRLLGAS
jgi:predicted ABC-type ATPase